MFKMKEWVTKPNIKQFLGVGLIAIVAFIFRFHQLGMESMWVDEIVDFYNGKMNFLEMLAAVRHHRGGLPLHYIITYIVERFGQSEIALRMPAALFSSLAVIPAFYFARSVYREKGKGVAWVFVTMMALTVFQIRYAQEARFYALFILLSITLWWRFFQAINTDKKRDWVIYAALGVISSYAHYYTFVILLCQGMIVMIKYLLTFKVGEKPQTFEAFQLFKKVFYVCVFIMICFTPALLVYTTKLGKYAYSAISWREFIPVLRIMTGGISAWLGLLVLPSLLHRQKKDKSISWLILLSIIVMVSVVVGLNIWRGYFYHVRQLLFVQPLILLLMAGGIYNLVEMILGRIVQVKPASVKKGSLIIGIILAIIIHLPLTLIYKNTAKQDLKLFVFENKKPEWKTAARYLEVNAGSGNLIICLDHLVKKSLDFYFKLHQKTHIQTVQVNHDIGLLKNIIKAGHHNDYWFMDGGIFDGYSQRLNPDERNWLIGKFAHEKDFYKMHIYRVDQSAKKEEGAAGWNIDLGKPISWMFLGEGWWEDTVVEEGRDAYWSKDRKSGFVLPLQNGQPGKIIIRVRPAVPQEISVVVNEKKVGNLKLDEGWGKYEIDLQEAEWRIGNNSIEFEYTKAERFKLYTKLRSVLWDYCRFVKSENR